MSTTSIYKVSYHLEIGNKHSSEQYVDYVTVATPDFSSIQTALTNNGKIRGGKTLHIDSVSPVVSGLS